MEIVEVRVDRGDVSFGMQRNAEKEAARQILEWVAAMREEMDKRKNLPRKRGEKNEL